MSSIPATDGSAYSNPYSSASRRKAEEEEERKASGAEDGASGAKEPAPTGEEVQALADYKKDFLNRVKALMIKPHLANVGLELDITDAGFQRMMQDSGYEKSVLDRLADKTSHTYTPRSGTIKLSADGETEPSATFAESKTVSEILFKTSNRTLLRTLGIDSMMAMADEVLSSRGAEQSRFDMAGRLSALQMRSTGTYLESYLNSLNSVDTTG